MDKNKIEIDDIEIENHVPIDDKYSRSINKDPTDKHDVFKNQVQHNQDAHFEIDNLEKFKVPPSLKKTFLCTLALFFVGVTLIILGFIDDIREADPGKGVTYWVLGGIVMIPGGYYTYQFYKAKKAKDLEERQEILDNIPEL